MGYVAMKSAKAQHPGEVLRSANPEVASQCRILEMIALSWYFCPLTPDHQLAQDFLAKRVEQMTASWMLSRSAKLQWDRGK
jgi:hypothetical protein